MYFELGLSPFISWNLLRAARKALEELLVEFLVSIGVEG